jgi:peptidoglycan/xylan/chitin deacetylase (PgdA/CDA1 family)
VLCYHALSEDWPATLATTPTLLSWQVRRLLGRGLRPARFTETVVGTEGQRTVSVTFDDAFRSVRTLGFPILRELGVPATVFVPTAHVGGARMRWPGIDEWSAGPHEPELVGCTWDELAELAEAGWEIGSHTRTHPHLTEIDEESLRRELEKSRQELEAGLERPCPSLAYPYADVDARVVAAARAAGYSAAATVFGSYDAGDDPLRQPRLLVYHHDTLARFRWKARPGVYGLLTSRPVRALRRVVSRA